MNSQTKKHGAVKLDWSRLLGFDQVSKRAVDARVSGLSDPRLTRIGAKVGIAKTGPQRDTGRN